MHPVNGGSALQCVYIGEPLAGLAFALIGVRRLSPQRSPGAVAEALEAARGDCDLVLIENDYASLIVPELRAAIIADPVPPVIIVPNLAREERLADDTVREASAVLGLSR